MVREEEKPADQANEAKKEDRPPGKSSLFDQGLMCVWEVEMT